MIFRYAWHVSTCLLLVGLFLHGKPMVACIATSIAINLTMIAKHLAERLVWEAFNDALEKRSEQRERKI